MSPWRVTLVTALPNEQLQVSFVDGTAGKVDMRKFLSSGKVDGTVQWPKGADLAPDAMYDSIRESGVWVLD